MPIKSFSWSYGFPVTKIKDSAPNNYWAYGWPKIVYEYESLGTLVIKKLISHRVSVIRAISDKAGLVSSVTDESNVVRKFSDRRPTV